MQRDRDLKTDFYDTTQKKKLILNEDDTLKILSYI